MKASLDAEKKWRYAVRKRDRFKCKRCGEKNRKLLQVHHIKRYADFPMLRTQLRNGITLCKKCHLSFKGREELYEYECNMLIAHKKSMMGIIQRLAKMKAEENE